VARGGAALAAATTPVLVHPGVAGAVVNDDFQQASLTFTRFDSVSVTCTISGLSEHDTDADTASAQSVVDSDSGCRSSASLRIAYGDEEGDAHTSTAHGVVQPGFTLGIDVDHAVSQVVVTHSVDFLDCDPSRNATCHLSFTTRPK
jgi:hypothetical protein